MPSVEKQFLLTKGPPWGFRLYLDNNGILTISKIRRHSPAETGNLHSGDQIIRLNGKSTTGMSHAEAVNFIDTTIGTLNLIITRFESVSTKILTGVGKPEINNFDNVRSNLNLDLKRNEASPEMPKVPSSTPEVEIVKEIEKEVEAPKAKDIVIPSSPDIQPIEISKLIKDFTDSEQPYTYVPKKKQFADSAFYSDPQNLYPTMEEKVAMARKVATSLTAPDNKNSKGASIFEKQRKRAEKYTLKSKEDTPPHVHAHETPNYDLEHWPQIMEPRDKSPSPMYTLGYSTKQSSLPPPPPPPPPPNEAKSIQEFMEKVQKFPKTKHNEITPQACFDIAAALHSSNSRGAQIFAQKKNRSKKWELSTPEPAQPQPVMVSNKGPWNDGNIRNSFPQQNKPTPRIISVVRSNSTNINKGENSNVIENSGIQTRKPTHVIRRNSNQGYQEPIKINNPTTMSTSKNVPLPQSKETTQKPTTNQWKPVKFNIPQKA